MGTENRESVVDSHGGRAGAVGVGAGRVGDVGVVDLRARRDPLVR
jgi:hypothetical protein